MRLWPALLYVALIVLVWVAIIRWVLYAWPV